MKKKGLIIGIAVVLVAVACIAGAIAYNNHKQDSGSQTNGAKSSNKSSNSERSKKVSDTNLGKTLVVYFSGQGHTKDAAEQIADQLGADTFEIEPANPYTDDDLNWNDDNSRVNREHEDESLRDVELKTTEVPNWDDYNTVLIGYPIWWGIEAWPIDGFVKAQDFGGKQVYPFCTSYSSSIGSSDDNLKAEASGGEWHDGQCFTGNGGNSKEISDWVNLL